MKFSVLWEAGTILASYFRPSFENWQRFTGLICSLVLVPASNVILPKLFLEYYGSDNSEDKVSASFVPALTVALLFGAQQSLTATLSQSLIQAIRRHNVDLLLDDDTKFLIKAKADSAAEKEKFTSIQYVTVGKGVDDFSTNTIGLFVALPSYIISTASTFVYIGLSTESFKSSGYVLLLGSSSALSMLVFMAMYSSYNQKNQVLENKLVAKIGFLEAHKSAVSLMGGSEIENKYIQEEIKKVHSTIPKLAFLASAYYTLMNLSPAIAGHFLGGYYSDNSITKLSSVNKDFLNVMIMTMINNVSGIVVSLSTNYTMIELNVKELKAFYSEYKKCLDIRLANNKMTQEFDGYEFSLIDFCVSPHTNPDGLDTSTFVGLKNVTLNLATQKFYRVVGPSGCGKTTFLKAITNNWDYTDGIVRFPKDAFENIHYIPQEPFIPQGTLYDIITYAITKISFLTSRYLFKEVESSIAIENISISVEEESKMDKETAFKEVSKPLINKNALSLQDGASITDYSTFQHQELC